MLREAVAALQSNGTLRDRRIAAAVAADEPLSGALQRAPEQFPPEEIALLQAGEESGRLEESLDRLALLAEERTQRERRLARALRLPVVNIHAAALLLPVAFLGMRANLSVGTYLPLVGALLLPFWAFVFVIRRMRGDARGRARLNRWVSFLPGFGRAALHERRGRYASVLEAASEAGMQWDRAVTLACEATGQEGAAGAEQAIRAGQPLVSALSHVALFSASTLSVLATAEQAGDLARTLRRIATEEEEAARSLLEASTGAFAKGIYILVLLLVGLFVILFYLQYLGQTKSLFRR